jgi:hypothetical protein
MQIQDKLNSEPRYKREFINYMTVIDTLNKETKRNLQQIFPTTKRFKRGLIDGLGTVFKAITGNLDAKDGERYESVINELRKTSDIQNQVITKNIMLTADITNEFNKTISTIKVNEDMLASKIIQLENTIENVQLHEIDMYSLLNIHTMCTQISAILNLILHLSNSLEEAITFAKLEIMHPSIITPEELIINLKEIKSKLNKEILPYDTTKQNINLYEKLITVKAYQIKERIIFILEIPLINDINYEYYHLYPIPVKTKINYQIILPDKPFLLLSRNSHISMNNVCKKTQEDEYICEQLDEKITTDTPCEVHLIRYQNSDNCHPQNLNITGQKILRIKQDTWVIVLTEETIVTSVCNRVSDKIVLKGSYVLQIPIKCSVTLMDTTLQNNYFLSYIKNIVPLPIIKYNFSNQHTQQNFVNHIALENIDLENINNLKQKLLLLPKNLHKIDESFGHLQVSNTVMIISIIILLIIIYIAYKFNAIPIIFKKLKIPVNKSVNVANQKIEILP